MLKWGRSTDGGEAAVGQEARNHAAGNESKGAVSGAEARIASRQLGAKGQHKAIDWAGSILEPPKIASPTCWRPDHHIQTSLWPERIPRFIEKHALAADADGCHWTAVNIGASIQC